MYRISLLLLSAVFVALLVPSAAAATVTIGNDVLAPNTAGQLVPIFISGTDSTIIGTNLTVLIGDGGPERTQFGITPAGTDAPGAEVPSVDVILAGTGPNGATLFSSNHTTQIDQFSGLGGSVPQLVSFSINTSLGMVSDNVPGSVLAYLRISTVGFNSGTWTVALDDSSVGGIDVTNLVLSTGTISPTLINGSFTVTSVPEPSSLVLGLLAVAAFSGCAYRRRKRTLSAPA